MPVIVDLNPQSRCIDVEQVAEVCGPRTKAVIATHLHGAMVDMQRLRDVVDARGSAIVEDACQCAAAIVDGRPAGSWGDVGIFSFGGSKLLTAGRGGAVATARADVVQRMRVFGDRGNAAFPLSELQAAVLLPQLAKLPARRDQRRRAAARIASELQTTSEWIPVPEGELNRNDYYKLGFVVEFAAAIAEEGPAIRDALSVAARAEGISLDPGFRGFLSRSPRRRRQHGDCAVAHRAIDRTLILHHPHLISDDATLDRLAKTLAGLATAFRNGTLKAAEIARAAKFDGR